MLKYKTKSGSSWKLINDSKEDFYLSKSIFVWFTNLRELIIDELYGKYIKKDLWCTLNESKLQSIKLHLFPLEIVNYIWNRWQFSTFHSTINWTLELLKFSSKIIQTSPICQLMSQIMKRHRLLVCLRWSWNIWRN